MVVALTKSVAMIQPVVRAIKNSLGDIAIVQLFTIKLSGISRTMIIAKAPRNEPQESKCCQAVGIFSSIFNLFNGIMER